MTDTTNVQASSAAPVEATTTTQAPAAPEVNAADPAVAPATDAQATDTDATSDDSATSQEQPSADDSAADAKPKKKKGGGFQDRINELTREKYEEQMRREDAERRLAELTKQANPADDLTADPGPEPALEQFTTVEEFQKAYEGWAKRVGYQQAQKEAKQKSQQEQALSVRATMAAREDAAQQKYPDYREVIAPVAPVIMKTPVLRQYMIESESGTDVAYHLAKNPEVLRDIQRMTPFQAGRELIKLEAKLAAPPPPKPVTKAPDPIKPVGQSEKAPFSYETASMEEYARKRREERRKRKG